MQPRMLEIPTDQLTEAQKAVLAARMAGPIASIAGPAIPLIRSPVLMQHLQQVGEHLRTSSAVGLRLHALAILLVARHWTQQYVWDYWRPISEKAGIASRIADAIAVGQRPVAMTSEEEAVYEFVCELLADKAVGDKTYADVARRFGEQGVVDLVAAVGHFSSMSMQMNVARTPLPEGHSPALPPLSR